MKRNEKGFTLIELLIIIGIIGFLASAILVAVDPVKRIHEARNAKRWSEVNGLLNAVLTKQVDDRAPFTGSTNYPVIASDTKYQIIINVPADGIGNAPLCNAGTPPTCAAIGANLQTAPSATASCYANLGATVGGLVPTWIADIPADPATGLTTNTQYYLQRNTSGRIEIGACAPEDAGGTPTIKVKR